jgi:uncharacterized membrane protein YozB (DUF420 family)
MTDLATAVPSPGQRNSWRLRLLLGLTSILVLRFLAKYAVPYLALSPEYYGEAFWSRRYVLLAHLGGGAIAIVVGPIQLWLGEHRLHMPWHRKLGKLYLAGVALGCSGGYYLALTSQTGWVTSAGLFGLAVAWTITTGMAYLAIRRGAIAQHREWMVRSYVVTLAFVFYRLFDEVMDRMGVGDYLERGKAAAWFCWAVPLLLAEPLIQLGKLRVAVSSAHEPRKTQNPSGSLEAVTEDQR